jgi:hypothetical protein
MRLRKETMRNDSGLESNSYFKIWTTSHRGRRIKKGLQKEIAVRLAALNELKLHSETT